MIAHAPDLQLSCTGTVQTHLATHKYSSRLADYARLQVGLDRSRRVGIGGPTRKCGASKAPADYCEPASRARGRRLRGASTTPSGPKERPCCC